MPNLGDTEAVLSDIQSRMAQQAALNLRPFPIVMDFSAGDLTLEGEVPTVAAKKTALAVAGQHPAVLRIIDRLRVAPAERMTDGAIRQRLRDVFNQEPAFQAHRIVEHGLDGAMTLIQDLDAPLGQITYRVSDGVVFLQGSVHGLDERRLAAVLAWWVPGTRDVVADIAVNPAEDDNDSSLADGIRMVLDKDPMVAAVEIQVRIADGIVHLGGAVDFDAEREAAEHDAWYVPGVNGVINEIRVA